MNDQQTCWQFPTNVGFLEHTLIGHFKMGFLETDDSKYIYISTFVYSIRTALKKKDTHLRESINVRRRIGIILS